MTAEPDPSALAGDCRADLRMMRPHIEEAEKRIDTLKAMALYEPDRLKVADGRGALLGTLTLLLRDLWNVEAKRVAALDSIGDLCEVLP